MTDKPLTNKHQAFCREYVIDSNGKQAAIRAGYAPKNAVITASKYLTISKVKQEIARLQAEIREEVGYTVAQCQQELDEARLLALQHNQPSAAVSAITTKARLFGMLTDNLNTANTQTADPLTPEEQELYARLAAELTKPKLVKDAG